MRSGPRAPSSPEGPGSGLAPGWLPDWLQAGFGWLQAWLLGWRWLGFRLGSGLALARYVTRFSNTLQYFKIFYCMLPYSEVELPS